MNPTPLIRLGTSSIQGTGVFATRAIRKGARIAEYTGERIGHDEADARYEDDASMTAHHTFLFAVDEHTVIDGAVGGNDSRFVNHSCDPNCEARVVRGRIYLHALRAIAAGEELTYDYAYERIDEFDNPESERRYACRCGAASCRGTILAPKRA